MSVETIKNLISSLGVYYVAIVLVIQLALMFFIYSRVRKDSTSKIGAWAFAFLSSEAILFLVSGFLLLVTKFQIFPRTSILQMGWELGQRVNARYPFLPDFKKNTDNANTPDDSVSSDNKTSNGTNDVNPECSRLEQNVRDELSTVNNCITDLDCVAAKTHTGCPFGCTVIVNKLANLKELEQAEKKYASEGCYTCTYKCSSQITSEEIKCVNKKCEDIRTLVK